VVTPTLKAAKVAQSEIGAHAGSAGWLAFQHGWRWDTHVTWTRLVPGDLDPVTGRDYVGPVERATLRAGDLLILDEAGMLDQDTALALLTIADEHDVRLALLGDRHQLSAVGRGGALDLAARWAVPDACLTLDVVHRFTRDIADANGSTRTVPDVKYADLTVAMRTGDSPGDVFDVLLARNQIQLHSSAADLQAALAETVAAHYSNGDHVAVVVDTRDQAGALNAAIRARFVAAGRVDDSRATSTGAGERIGVGDRVATRRNDRDLDVANRDMWTVTGSTGTAG
jgi:exodeoxyribonuclease V alpha subunit